jgi:hypothetical protein
MPSRFTRVRRHGTALALAALLALPAGAALADQAGQVTIDDPHALVSPRHPGGGIFMTLRNGGDSAVAITGAEAPVADRIHLGGCRRGPGGTGELQVEPIDRLNLPAGGSLELTRGRGGRHLCITGVTEGFIPGKSFPLTLRFADGSERVVEVEVTGVAKPMMFGGQGRGQGQGQGRQ